MSEPDEIADWCARRYSETQRLAALLYHLRRTGAPRDQIRKVEHQLEMARYVGD